MLAERTLRTRTRPWPPMLLDHIHIYIYIHIQNSIFKAPRCIQIKRCTVSSLTPLPLTYVMTTWHWTWHMIKWANAGAKFRWKTNAFKKTAGLFSILRWNACSICLNVFPVYTLLPSNLVKPLSVTLSAMRFMQRSKRCIRGTLNPKGLKTFWGFLYLSFHVFSLYSCIYQHLMKWRP